jgi:glycosyltransferase involved in cell wall biosynthesis
MKVQTLAIHKPVAMPTTFQTPLPDIRRDSRRSTRSFSILTPSLNGATYFQQTRDSVMSQSGDFNLQWIVIDGGSHDGTIDHLQSINDPRVQWISEADHGQSAAINKGLAMARGGIVAWLNSDDLYLPGALSEVADAFTAHPEAQWLIGRCNIIDKVGRVTREVITHYKERRLHDITLKGLLRENMICQPAVFWRWEFGQSVGLLDESLRYTMDYDLWLRMAKQSKPLIINRTLASFRVHMASKSRGGHREQFNEGYRVACRYFGNDRLSQFLHRVNVEKIVWGYHTLRLLGR